MKFRFNLNCFIASVLIFLTEVLIATKLKNLFFIRAYLGDVIVVVLIYTFVLSFLDIKNKKVLILGIFLFSCVIEFAQYFGIAEALKFEKGSIARIVVGSSFSWWDILCYSVGCLFLWIISGLKQEK